MTTIIKYLIRYRLIAILLVLGLVGGFGFFATRIAIDNSLEMWFVDDDPTLLSYRNFLKKFSSDEVVVTAIHSNRDVFEEDRLARLLQLTRKLSEIDGVTRVLSLANATIARESSNSSTLVPVVNEPVDDEDVERARDTVSQRGLGSRFVGQDGKTLVTYTWLGATADIDQKRGSILDEIRALTASSITGTGEHANHGGYGVIYDALNRATLGEGALFIGLSYLVVILALYFITRRLTWTVLAVIVITLADLTMFGTMALLGRPINLVTAALPTLVMVLGVANVLHMATHLDGTLSEKRNQLGNLIATLSAVAIPCLFNALTTAGGLLSLTAASMAVTRDFGLFAALGVFLAFLFSFIGMAVLLPQTVRLRPPKRMKTQLAKVVESIMVFSIHQRKVVVLVTVFLGLLAFLGISRIVVDTNSIGFLSKNHSSRRESVAIEESLGPYIPLEMTIQAQEKGSWRSAAFLKSLARAQADLEADPAIGSTLSVADVLHDLHMTITGRPVARPWEPTTDDEVLRVLSFIETAGEELGLKHLVAQDDRTIRLTATVAMASAKDIMTVAKRAQEKAQRAITNIGEVVLTGYMPLYGQIIVHVVNDQVRSFSLAFLVVFLLVALVLRSWRFTLVAIPSNLLPVALVLGLMGFSGIRLDIATVTIAAMVLGIIVDDSVHILYRLRRALKDGHSFEEAMRLVARVSGVAIVSTSFVFCAGFAIIAFASVRSVAYVGLLTAIAVVAALITDLLLLPAIASFLIERPRRQNTMK